MHDQVSMAITATSAWTAMIAYIDGGRSTRDPCAIAMGDHTEVQHDVGCDVPPRSYTFPSGP